MFKNFSSNIKNIPKFLKYYKKFFKNLKNLWPVEMAVLFWSVFLI